MKSGLKPRRLSGKWVALVLVVLLVGGMAACGNGDGDADLTGTWVLSFNWGCVGSSSSAIWSMFSNGTFTDSQGASGIWTTDGKNATIRYNNGTTYTGTVDGNVMSGTMRSLGGSSGCWSATR